MSDAAPANDLGSRLGDVRASVRPNLEISRHLFSGKPTYVVRDPVTAQSHRFAAQDYQLFISIDQTRTLKETVQQLVTQKRITEEQVDDFYRFVVHLHQMGLLTLPLSDGSSLHNRYKQRMDMQKKGKLLKLLFLKVPLAQPDKWLAHTLHWFAPLFTLTAFWIWLACSLVSCSILLMHWREFVDPLGTMLTLSNVPILWFLLVTLKAFHELGHAYACKRFGGTVPEIGAMFMMGTPCAYVDASASWSFPNRWHRMIVALAGMYFESMLSMVALVIWLSTSTGQIHSAAQYAIILSTVVTIGFNANPLMRYDGYFILCDLVNIPNLHRDAKAAAASLIKRVLFGVQPKSNGNSWWYQVSLTLFGLCCMMYGVTVALGIATLLTLSIPIAGPAVALFVSGLPFAKTLQRWFQFITKSKELETARMRAYCVSASLVAILILGIFMVPCPSSVQAFGIVHRHDEQSIRANVGGFLVRVPTQLDRRVSTNDALYELENPELFVQLSELEAQIQQYSIQLQTQLTTDRANAEQTEILLRGAREQYENVQSQLRELTVRSKLDGEFEPPKEVPCRGKYVRKGESLGTLCRGPWNIKVKLTADQWASMESHLDAPVSVRLIGYADHELRGKIVSTLMAGSKKIDEVALTHSGGGNIAVGADMTASESFFDVLVEIDDRDIETAQSALKLGMSARVSFHGNTESLASVLSRRTLRLLNQIRQAAN